MTAPRRADDGRTVTVRIPISIRRRAGRKLVLAPDGAASAWAAPPRQIDSALVKAITRAFCWRKLLETGVYVTVGEIAAAEKVNPSYVSRVLRLTLLAPEIVEAILDGRQPAEMTLAALMEPFGVAWKEQKSDCIGPWQKVVDTTVGWPLTILVMPSVRKAHIADRGMTAP